MGICKADKVVENNGRKLEFFEESHSYLMDGEHAMTSASTLIKSHFPEFETEKIAQRYADKRGLKKEDVIKAWEENTQRACDFGTMVHTWAERMLLGESLEVLDKIPKDEKGEAYYLSLKKYYLEHFIKRYKLIEAEMTVFHPDFFVAGTMDILAEEIRTGKICVLDWKTNKAIEKFCDFNRFGKGFLRHMDDCNFSHYSLQLNLYDLILREQYAMDPNKMERRVLHITPEKVLTYLIDDYQEEAKLLLKSNLGQS